MPIDRPMLWKEHSAFHPRCAENQLVFITRIYSKWRKTRRKKTNVQKLENATRRLQTSTAKSTQRLRGICRCQSLWPAGPVPVGSSNSSPHSKKKKKKKKEKKNKKTRALKTKEKTNNNRTWSRASRVNEFLTRFPANREQSRLSHYTVTFHRCWSFLARR